MNLALEVTKAPADAVEASSRKIFTEAGGTIGRGGGNHWVLQHPFVSGVHAQITYADGVFYIEDVGSRNGIFVNSSETPLEKGRRRPLQAGDSILIDPFTLQASISGEPQFASASPAWDVFDSTSHADSVFTGRRDVYGDLFGKDRPAPPGPVSGGSDRDLNSFLSERIRTPHVVSEPPTPPDTPAIPSGYNPAHSVLISRSNVPEDAPVPPARPQDPARAPNVAPIGPKPMASGPSRRGGEEPVRPAADVVHRKPVAPSPVAVDAGLGSLATMLAAAGLAHAQVTPEIASHVGAIFRVVVQGVLDVLVSRRELKSEIGVENTIFSSRKNNPLKYSTDVDDALHNLFVRRHPGYLGPVEAFEDAFEDLRNHQVAMLAGVRAAFDAMLAEFEPKRLEETFDRRMKDSFALVPNRFRYWEHYREQFDEMKKNADATVSRLFRDQFASAYEAQLEQLKAHGRARKS